jgi:hypothetical protein
VLPEVESLINRRLVKQLVVLELADQRLAETSYTGEPSETLYYRLVGEAEGTLRLELWSLGEFYGHRKVSTKGRGQKLLARHIALAAAELAQRLSKARRREALQRQREAEQTSHRAAEERARVRNERWRLQAGGEGLWVGRGQLVLGGPTLGFQLNRSEAGRLGLRLSMLAGSALGLDGVSGVRWFELGVAPAYRLDRWNTQVGLDLSAAVVHFNDVAALDAIPGQHQTWTARLGVHVQYQPELMQGLRLNIVPAAGTLLRSIPLRASSGGSRQIAGFWAGLSLGILLDS